MNCKDCDRGIGRIEYYSRNGWGPLCESCCNYHEYVRVNNPPLVEKAVDDAWERNKI